MSNLEVNNVNPHEILIQLYQVPQEAKVKRNLPWYFNCEISGQKAVGGLIHEIHGTGQI